MAEGGGGEGSSRDNTCRWGYTECNTVVVW